MRWENREPKTPRAYRFTEETIRQIDLLSERLGVNRTEVLERAIEDLLRRTPAS